jgi:hypothetical protein
MDDNTTTNLQFSEVVTKQFSKELIREHKREKEFGSLVLIVQSREIPRAPKEFLNNQSWIKAAIGSWLTIQAFSSCHPLTGPALGPKTLVLSSTIFILELFNT